MVEIGCSPSLRTDRPLGCFFWGHVCTLSAWRETRGVFAVFASTACSNSNCRRIVTARKRRCTLAQGAALDVAPLATTIAEIGKRRLNQVEDRCSTTCNRRGFCWGFLQIGRRK